MMWEVSAVVPLAARHQIRDASGEGGRVHGHQWRIRAAVRATRLDATGWVVDFQVLADALRSVVASYENRFINEVDPFQDVNPTRENVSRVLADALAAKIDDGRATVHRLEIWESDVCCAVFFRE